METPIQKSWHWSQEQLAGKDTLSVIAQSLKVNRHHSGPCSDPGQEQIMIAKAILGLTVLSYKPQPG